MMDQATVAKTAKLARIRLSEEEQSRLAGDLSNILDWIEQLDEVNTDGVAQMTSVVERGLPMREDTVNDGNIQEKILSNAPSSEYGCFAVPKVVE